MIRAKKNLSLIGPPGSGKGSYGKYFAQALELPVFAVSDFIRLFQPHMDISSGHLVNDRIVSETVLQGLKESPKNGYILDGFPRTLKQAALMEQTWPSSFQVQAAIKLAVPDIVCETKLLGRRLCTKCGETYNVNGVHWNGWEMPPHLPKTKCDPQCDPNQDWVTRQDDTPNVVKHRLRIYHENMDPILEYFEARNGLLKLCPFQGFDELPKLIDTAQKWLKGH